jgi:hypothetical protein
MKQVSYLVAFGLYTLVFIDQALAYLDPGSGSMILQLLFGGIAGGVIIMKLYWSSFLNLFRHKRAQQQTLSSQKEIHE